MNGILCRANGVPHRHDTAAHVRACHVGAGIIGAPAPHPVSAPVRPHDTHPARRVIRTQDDPTPAQLKYITGLGGDGNRAAHMTRLGASQYIQQLKAAKENKPVIDVVPPKPKPPVTIVPIPLLQAVRPGRYAFRPDSNTKWTFVRVSVPKNGRLKDCLKVQTQHGDDLTDRMTVYPSGHVWLDGSNRFIESVLLGIIVDQTQAAIDYGREIGRCCRCGKALTDERSRHYGTGPECEKVWSHVINAVDEASGGSYEWLVSRGMIAPRH